MTAVILIAAGFQQLLRALLVPGTARRSGPR